MRARRLGVIAAVIIFGALISALLLRATTSAREREKSETPQPPNLEERVYKVFLARAQPDMMALHEREPFFEFVRRLAKWKTGTLSAEEMHASLGWEKREWEARFVVPRRKLRLGEELKLAIVLHNPLDRPQVVFPFERVRYTERGKKDNGTRVCGYSLQEEPQPAGHLYVVPPHDELVIPVSLPPEPAGTCRVNLDIRLSSFVDASGEHAYELKTLATGVVEFTIYEADN